MNVLIDTKRSQKSTYSISVILFISIFFALGVRIYAMNVPITYDEAYTFLRFIDKPFSTIVSDYSVANNHVFFSIVAKISTLIFGDSIWSIRLPSLLFGIFTIVLNYIFWRKVAGRTTAVIATLFVSSSLSLISYSAQARGYSMQAFLFLLSFLLADNLRANPVVKNAVIFSLVTSLYLFTIPTGLYGVGSVFIWLMILAVIGEAGTQRYKLIKLVFLSGFLAISFTIILYGPILLHYHGFPDIKQASTLTIPEIIEHAPRAFRSVVRKWNKEFSQVTLVCSYIGLVMSMIGIIVTRAKKVSALIISLISALVIMVLVTRVLLPFQRTWMYFLPFYLGLISYGLAYLLEAIRLRHSLIYNFSMVAIFTIVLGLGGYNSYGVLSKKVVRETDNANVLYDSLSRYAEPGDFIACPEILCDRLRFFWHLDKISLRKIKVGWDCNVVQIRRAGKKSQPFQKLTEKVYLLTRKERDREPFLKWIDGYVPDGFQLIEKEVTRHGDSQILSFSLKSV